MMLNFISFIVVAFSYYLYLLKHHKQFRKLTNLNYINLYSKDEKLFDSMDNKKVQVNQLRTEYGSSNANSSLSLL